MADNATGASLSDEATLKMLERERKAQAQPKAAKPAKKKVNPVKQGIRNRRKAAKEERERRDKYFHDAAVQAAIERRKQQSRGE